MICKEFSHVTPGDVGEGVIRQALVTNLQRPGLITMLDEDAHRSHRQAIEIGGGPAFTSVRNPFDYYVSRYFHELKNRRYFGPFVSWFHDEKLSFAASWKWFADPGIPKEHVVRFEHIEEDFPRILHDIYPVLSVETIAGYFPRCYAQWSGRLWSESIEQWLRDDLYTEEMKEQVYEQDRWIFDEWGYTFEERYISTLAPN